MAQWQRTLRLQPEWGRAKDGEITVQELSGTIAKRLRALRPFIGQESFLDQSRNDLADEFEAASNDQSLTSDEFDGLMGDLYDWGDMRLDDWWNGRKVCWVDTIGIVARAALQERS